MNTNVKDVKEAKDANVKEAKDANVKEAKEAKGVVALASFLDALDALDYKPKRVNRFN
jgi:ABC-type Fe3+-citrate transport system substrate-binding protein